MTDDPPRTPTDLQALTQRVQDIEHRLDGIAPTAPCGKLSRVLPITIGALLALAATSPKSAKHTKKWRRICIAPLGHPGPWHRSEDGQVWHDVDCRTPEQATAEDAERRRQNDLLSASVVTTDQPETETR